MTTKAIAAALAVVSLSGPAHAETYHRFWRGMKLASLSSAEFERGLNEVFIPATVSTGAGKGLLAYEPALTSTVPGLPDEIALVSYDDRDTYDALYATAPGKAYQNLHWQYFDKAASHSLTPIAFEGRAHFEEAYDLKPAYSGWRANTTSVVVGYRHADETDANYLERVTLRLKLAERTDPESGILDRAVLVAKDYWIEYVSAVAPLADPIGADRMLPVRSEAPADAKIEPGAGVNLLF